MAGTRWGYIQIVIHRYMDEDFYRWREEGGTASGSGFEKIINILNLFGGQGWELVNIEKQSYTFKRELID